MSKKELYLCDLCGKLVYHDASDPSPAVCSRCGRILKRKFKLEDRQDET
jgi:DNA-directed RNA polymerase subunit RPC12/RpoP